MPNRRDPDKKKLTAWMYEEDINVLKEVAKQRGITLTDLLNQLADDLRRRNKKQK